jgi:hypothetical protein
MTTWTRGRTLLVGVVLILLTNALALGGAWWNRSGEAESQLLLTERELMLPYRGYRHAENSGLALRLGWRMPDELNENYSSHAGSRGVPDWFDAERMAALGFKIPAGELNSEAQRRYERQLPREVLVVLELAGPAWQAALARARENAARHAAAADVNADSKDFANRAKRAQEALQREEHANSRLFAIDGGPDLATLRARYPDRSRFMIVTATVKPRVLLRDKEKWLAGYLADISFKRINVPFALRPVLERLTSDPQNKGDEGVPRFEASLAVGRRLEPWITSLALAPAPR